MLFAWVFHFILLFHFINLIFTCFILSFYFHFINLILTYFILSNYFILSISYLHISNYQFISFDQFYTSIFHCNFKIFTRLIFSILSHQFHFIKTQWKFHSVNDPPFSNCSKIGNILLLISIIYFYNRTQFLWSSTALIIVNRVVTNSQFCFIFF